MYTAIYLTGWGDSSQPNYNPITILCDEHEQVVDCPDGLEFLRDKSLPIVKRWLRRKWATNAAFRECLWSRLSNNEPLINLPL